MTLLQNPGECKNLPPGMGKNWIHRRDTLLKNKQKSAPCGALWLLSKKVHDCAYFHTSFISTCVNH